VQELVGLLEIYSSTFTNNDMTLLSNLNRVTVTRAIKEINQLGKLIILVEIAGGLDMHTGWQTGYCGNLSEINFNWIFLSSVSFACEV
jgi:hypothetical protein